MSKKETIRIGLIGAGWITTVHYDSFKQIPGAEIVAQADIDEQRLKEFAHLRPVPQQYTDIDEMLSRDDIDVVTVAVPNRFHGHYAIKALEAGKHVIVEKPLTTSITEAQKIVELSERNQLVVGYAEELCYIPKFRRMKQIADSGGLGEVYMVKQAEKHAGPYSPWFFTREGAGGGILMDMGCHSIEFCRWFMDKKPVSRVYAHMNTYLHKQGEVEDHVILTMEFEDGTIGQVESSWALKGGMDSIAEAYGTKGVVYGDLLRGMGLRAYSEEGFAPEPNNRALLGGPESVGWSFPDYDWLWNNGYPQEMADFLDAIRNGTQPVESARDGLAVLEIMLAGYYSAGTKRAVELPFKPVNVEYPVDLWKNPPAAEELEFID